jgi:YVTN family beta-propeller protein
MPYAAVITRDKTKLYVSSSGANTITVIDIPKMLSYVHAPGGPDANDLSASANYVVVRIPVGRNPKGLVLSADGKSLYVANRLDDSISVIDTASDTVVSSIDLGGKQDMTSLRRGERVFYTARFAFQGQISCANCHIPIAGRVVQQRVKTDRGVWTFERSGPGDVQEERKRANGCIPAVGRVGLQRCSANCRII